MFHMTNNLIILTSKKCYKEVHEICGILIRCYTLLLHIRINSGIQGTFRL